MNFLAFLVLVLIAWCNQRRGGGGVLGGVSGAFLGEVLGKVLITGVVLLTLLVGSGFLPQLLLDRLQTEVPLVHFKWQAKNIVIVLGGGMTSWPAEAHRTSSSLWAISRVHEAARLYFECKQQAESCTVLASGGDPQRLGISEAEVIKRELVEIGLPETDVMLEPKSNNTSQNAQFTAAILRSQKPTAVVLVSSGRHLRRSLLYFSQFGVQVAAAPSDHLSAQGSWVSLSSNFFLTELALHEYTGILRFHLYDQFGWNRSSPAPQSPSAPEGD